MTNDNSYSTFTKPEKVKVIRDNNWYIRKAVELADGWAFQSSPLGNEYVETLTGYMGTTEDQEILDALAAQLVRQVDALKARRKFSSHGFGCILDVDGKPKNETVTRGPDRTLNTIKAIVDSQVLSTKGET